MTNQTPATTPAAEIAAFFPTSIGKLIRAVDEPKKANVVAYKNIERDELFLHLAVGEVTETNKDFCVTRNGKTEYFPIAEAQLLKVKGVALDLLTLGEDNAYSAWESAKKYC